MDVRVEGRRHLNEHADPGPNYVIQASMPAEAAVEVEGCVEGRQWCRATYDSQTGYAYASYLIVTEVETAYSTEDGH